MTEIRDQIKKMSLDEIIKYLFTIGKVGKDIWDKLKDTSEPRLKWRKEIVNLLDQKDIEILALKTAIKLQGEKIQALENILSGRPGNDTHDGN